MAVKVTLLFNAGTIDASGNAARSAGFSESYVTTVPIDSPTLQTNWNNLAIARAALLPANTRICGSRFQNIDPVGGSRQYDNVYPGTSSALNDLPSVALQWTIRSPSTPNQRSLILRGIPDARVVTGEYAPSAGYNAALQAFFAQLTANWQFRAINRTILPVKIRSVVASLMTTVTAHGLNVGDYVNVMSTNVPGDPVTKHSYTAVVIAPVTLTTATLALTGRNDFIPDSTGGRVRKAGIIYPNISITAAEIISPNAINRKAGAPFRKFRGRRTARR